VSIDMPSGKTGKETGAQGGQGLGASPVTPAPGKGTLTAPRAPASPRPGPASVPGKQTAVEAMPPQIRPPSSRPMVAPAEAPQPAPGSRSGDEAPRASAMGYRTPEEAKEELDNPTWDPNASYEGRKPGDKAGAWVEATAVRNADEAKSVNGDRERVDKRMVAGTTKDPAKANAGLEAGTLSKADLDDITVDQVSQMNPLGEGPKNVLKGPLHESWHNAKHDLLKDGDNQDARKMLMAKLWEFRQWHHNVILQRTQKDPTIGAEGLSDWKAAGSTTLTSDIDVNLKGSRTELAVAMFNKKFKEDGFTKEAGVVYDVNVYALDFMHKDTFKGLAEKDDGKIKRHDFSAEPKATRVSAKEGAREGAEGGGVTADNPMLSDRMVKADAELQRVWSLVKLRLYMTASQWTEYAVNSQLPPATKSAVDIRYAAYMKELEDKMLGDHPELRLAGDVTKTGFAQLAATADRKAGPAGDGEDVKMAASNRLYEKKLLEIATLRDRVTGQIEQRKVFAKTNPEDAEAMGAAIEGNLAMLRELISEAAMYSNEAYVTDGAVNHVVVGMQEKIGISQSGSESMDSFNENVADVLKEVARHSRSVGEAAYKAGKYIWRMADAARNVGSKDKDITTLYTAGYTLANEIKGGDEAQEDLERKAGAVLTKALGPNATDPDALMAFIRTVGARVARENAEAGNIKRAAPVKASNTAAPAK
jgi:hypothetical protein